ncbi:ATP phosphoribosyltransferase [Cryptosporangium sp. NPDC051539]|uniref:ATP phosphoribosyltransferase n=1 Tax=Cryptosporangium sp. NPDC051539 TaxID=3363962 RepID=UPI0037B116F7
MLRIAVPNKGSLSERATTILSEAGYRQRRDPKELVLVDAENEVEFFYLRPRDIAVYVGSGDLDLGVTGRDLLLDSGADAVEVLPLGFGASTFRFAARPGTVSSVLDLDGRRIATSYAGLVRSHLADHGVTAEVIRLDGAVETAIRLGVADVIADVVETGATLRQQGLEIVAEPILRSEAVVIRGKGRSESGDDHRVDQLTRRINGVLVARRYVMLAYDVELARLDDAVAMTPGIEGPTISPLHKDGWVAVQAMVPREDTNRIMDSLYDLGARAIIVTSIHACRL